MLGNNEILEHIQATIVEEVRLKLNCLNNARNGEVYLF